MIKTAGISDSVTMCGLPEKQEWKTRVRKGTEKKMLTETVFWNRIKLNKVNIKVSRSTSGVTPQLFVGGWRPGEVQHVEKELSATPGNCG